VTGTNPPSANLIAGSRTSAILRVPKASTVSTHTLAHPDAGDKDLPTSSRWDGIERTRHSNRIQIARGDARARDAPLPNVVNAKLLG
jgi:hypothetical protein